MLLGKVEARRDLVYTAMPGAAIVKALGFCTRPEHLNASEACSLTT